MKMGRYVLIVSLLALVILVFLPVRTWTANAEARTRTSNDKKVAAAASLSVSSQSLNRVARSLTSGREDNARQFCPDCMNPDAGVCTRQSLRHVKNYTRGLACQPEPTLVKLEKPGPSFVLEPSVAKVRRCSGFCRHSKFSCNPVQTSFVKVPVMLMSLANGGTTKCVHYEVEQHESCSCGCQVRKEHCSDRHKHDNCSCKYTNELEKYRCLQESTHERVWDEEKCHCVCKPEACSYGLTWDAHECRCGMPREDDDENQLF